MISSLFRFLTALVGVLINNFFRIIRAFLVEEQKIVKKVLKIQKAKEKQASKSWKMREWLSEKVLSFIMLEWNFGLGGGGDERWKIP